METDSHLQGFPWLLVQGEGDGDDTRRSGRENWAEPDHPQDQTGGALAGGGWNEDVNHRHPLTAAGPQPAAASLPPC